MDNHSPEKESLELPENVESSTRKSSIIFSITFLFIVLVGVIFYFNKSGLITRPADKYKLFTEVIHYPPSPTNQSQFFIYDEKSTSSQESVSTALSPLAEMNGQPEAFLLDVSSDRKYSLLNGYDYRAVSHYPVESSADYSTVQSDPFIYSFDGSSRQSFDILSDHEICVQPNPGFHCGIVESGHMFPQYTFDGGRFSPDNTHFFLTFQQGGGSLYNAAVGVLDGSNWSVSDIHSLIPELAATSTNIGDAEWVPGKPATLLLSYQRTSYYNGTFTPDAWLLVDFSENPKNPSIVNLGVNGNKIKFSRDGKSFLLYTNLPPAYPISFYSLTATGTELISSDIQSDAYGSIPKGAGFYADYQVSVGNPDILFVLTKSQDGVADLGGSGIPTYYKDNISSLDQWWAFDLKKKTAHKIFSEEGKAVLNDYIWSPASDAFAIRSEGTFRLVDSNGNVLYKDSMISHPPAPDETAAYIPSNSIQWSPNGQRIAYLKTADALIRDPKYGFFQNDKGSDGGGTVTILDTENLKTTTAVVPKGYYFADKEAQGSNDINYSFLIR